MKRRDEFTEQVKGKLAKRVAYRCSNPGCRKPTTGPRSDPEATVCIGVAAHIAAAAKGGPRFDPSMTPAERRAMKNGIWLCQNCAKLIDNDKDRFTAAVLRGWKDTAEGEARAAVEGTAHRTQSAPCPWCDPGTRSDMDRLDRLEATRRADQSARDTAAKQTALRRDLANRGMSESGAAISGMMRILQEHHEALLTGRVAAAGELLLRLCRSHRSELRDQVAAEIRESSAAGESYAVEQMHEQFKRAGVGSGSTEASLRSEYAGRLRSALNDLERAFLRAATSQPTA